MILYFDTETWSAKRLSYGTYKYHEASRVLLLPYAIDDEPVKVWRVAEGQQKPDDLRKALENPACKIVVHNILFDYLALLRLFPPIDISRWHCTMHQARAHSLPGGLDMLCDLFKLSMEDAKIKEADDLMKLFCYPESKADYTTHPAEWEMFVEYAKQDVQATRVLYKKLPKWNLSPFERAVFEANFRINQRGIHVDLEFAEAVVAVVEDEKKRLRAKAKEMTDDEVESTTQAKKLLEYINAAYGLEMSNLTKGTVSQYLDKDEIPEELKQLLKVRLQASKSSTSKYKALLNGASPDSRARGVLVLRGATRTGRIAHKLWQPGNLPRPTIPKDQIPTAIHAFLQGADDLIPDVMEAAASCVRGCITAPAGKKLLVGDFSNIEGRVAAWTSGEQWKLDAYAAYDEGRGVDLYIKAYSKLFGVNPDDVDDLGRQMGKVNELAFQFGGGVFAMVTGAATYRLDLNVAAKVIHQTAPGWALGEAEKFFKWWTEKMKKPDFGLSANTFIACDAAKRLWRAENPMIVKRWGVLAEQFKQAVITRTGSGTVSVNQGWIRNRLPSGRYLSYANMFLGHRKEVVDGQEQTDERLSLFYKGIIPKTNIWGSVPVHGGILFQHETQAIANDLLTYAETLTVKDIEVVLEVHDELVAEASRATAEDMKKLMETKPHWASGLPVAAKVFETLRYRKD